MIMSILAKNIDRNLVEIFLNVYINFRRIDIFIIVSLSINEHSMPLHLFIIFISFISVL